MSKKAFEKIAKGLREALSVARGESQPSKLHVPPPSPDPPYVPSLRHRLGLHRHLQGYVLGERDRALKLAAAVLERAYNDPDDDITVLARQLERQQEEIDHLTQLMCRVSTA